MRIDINNDFRQRRKAFQAPVPRHTAAAPVDTVSLFLIRCTIGVIFRTEDFHKDAVEPANDFPEETGAVILRAPLAEIRVLIGVLIAGIAGLTGVGLARIVGHVAAALRVLNVRHRAVICQI